MIELDHKKTEPVNLKVLFYWLFEQILFFNLSTFLGSVSTIEVQFFHFIPLRKKN